jgi:hypothetical protein
MVFSSCPTPSASGFVLKRGQLPYQNRGNCLYSLSVRSDRVDVQAKLRYESLRLKPLIKGEIWLRM